MGLPAFKWDNALVPLFVNVSGVSGDLVPAVSGKKTRLLGMVISNADPAAQSLTLSSGATIFGPHTLFGPGETLPIFWPCGICDSALSTAIQFSWTGATNNVITAVYGVLP